MTKQEVMSKLKELFIKANEQTQLRARDICLTLSDDTYYRIKEFIKKNKDKYTEEDLREAHIQPYLILEFGELQQIIDLVREVNS